MSKETPWKVTTCNPRLGGAVICARREKRDADGKVLQSYLIYSAETLELLHEVPTGDEFNRLILQLQLQQQKAAAERAIAAAQTPVDTTQEVDEDEIDEDAVATVPVTADTIAEIL